MPWHQSSPTSQANDFSYWVRETYLIYINSLIAYICSDLLRLKKWAEQLKKKFQSLLNLHICAKATAKFECLPVCCWPSCLHRFSSPYACAKYTLTMDLKIPVQRYGFHTEVCRLVDKHRFMHAWELNVVKSWENNTHCSKSTGNRVHVWNSIKISFVSHVPTWKPL